MIHFVLFILQKQDFGICFLGGGFFFSPINGQWVLGKKIKAWQIILVSLPMEVRYMFTECEFND